MVKPDFDRFSCHPLSERAALDEVYGNFVALSVKNNLSIITPMVIRLAGLLTMTFTLGGVYTLSSHSFHLRNIPHALELLVPKWHGCYRLGFARLQPRSNFRLYHLSTFHREFKR